jgi:Cysteine-rich domain
MKSMIYSKTGNPNKYIFAPGCALFLHKPESSERLWNILKKNLGAMDILQTCCRHDPELTSGTVIINVCPGCDKRFGNEYKNVSTISLWEILAGSDFAKFPDYGGRHMSILDACPTREQERVHNAIRTILKKMNITLEEPKNTRTKSTCCGDSFYGIVATEKLKELMVKRSSEMPVEDVVVYCISCIKAIFIGGKSPRYLIDLLFSEETFPGNYEPDEWHAELNNFIEKH